MGKHRMITKTQDLCALAICKSGRLDAILAGLAASPLVTRLYAFSEVDNPGLRAKAIVEKGITDDREQVKAFAATIKPDFVVIGPEEPLKAGVVDALEEMGIPCVGPKKELAKIEWSKSFARDVLAECAPDMNPRYQTFDSMCGVKAYLEKLREFVIKPDGLTGGKGVKVFGEHLFSIAEGLTYCEEVLSSGHSHVVIEERLEGEEFSLQSFCDGRHVVHMMPVQDHKRRNNGDQGPNTGGMGSYSCEDFSLPFLTEAELRRARDVNERVCQQLQNYKGILYGGFIATKHGLRVIEFNSRFGDPEVMNVLPLLETDFAEICLAIINGTLSDAHVRFARRATVCKYVVPVGYPTEKTVGAIAKSSIPVARADLRVFYAAVHDRGDDNLYLTGSRAIAFVGIGNSVEDAERIAEGAARQIVGPVHHRTDVGTKELIQRRKDHMNHLRASIDSRSKAA